MEECETPPAGIKRKAWAQSRDSWQASGSQNQDSEEQLSAQPMEDKPSAASQSGPFPNKIASWLRDCRTPLGSSLDERSTSPSKGLLKNGCSFEDDLSLGAEANHLQNSSAQPEANGYELQAKARRSQFKQKGRSMNSTGSAKSSTTVSSVSELLDLYEEDPEEVLYNLGFGREEPDIATKIPSRFFNSSSGAKGIDIKVYLGAQIQRMELENPNYALTSRFRQTEVLATVANVFSEIYSHVSGRPTEKIGNCDLETKIPSTLKRRNSALNAVKILKRTITKQNLLAPSTEADAKQLSVSDVEEGANPSLRDKLMDAEQKAQQKTFRRKDSSLPTVTEEAQQSMTEASFNGDIIGPLMNGDHSHSSEISVVDKDMPDSPVLVSISRGNDVSDLSKETLEEQGHQKTITSTPDKDQPNLLPNPHMAHLLSQPRDSFEMEELQSNEDEALPVPGGMSRPGSERFLRTTSQQSDSSGFAEDPSTDGSGTHLKVQESSDSCDSETTVTSHVGDPSTPVALEYPIFGKAYLQPTKGGSSQNEDNQEEFLSLEIPSPNSYPTSVSNVVCTSEAEQGNMSKSGLHVDPQTNKLKSSENFCVWVRDRDFLTGTENLDRNPLQRSSSLPTSPQSPSRVVTSLRIQLGRGSVKRCTPPSYTYHYEDGMHGDREEVDSIIEEDEDCTKSSTLDRPRPPSSSSWVYLLTPTQNDQQLFLPHQPHNVFTPPQGAPYASSLHHPYQDPYQPHIPSYCLNGYNNSQHPPGTPPFHPYFPLSYQTPPAPAPAPAVGSTEMQLRRVLHDIRGTMQNLNQSSSVHGGDTPIDRISTPGSVQPLYEELQMRRRCLNVFRTQMMDLELALMRQQSMVYQHLSPDERREADQLQTLRTAVRQELQDLELQLEDRLLNLNEQMRSSSQNSGIFRHHMGMQSGHSFDSLSNSSALQAMEPVNDLLREQLYLQSELGYEAASTISGRSSRASSPGRFSRTLEDCSPSPKQGGVYRATLSLTPSVPPRPGAEVPRPVSPEETEQSISPTSVEFNRDDDDDDDRSRVTDDCSPTDWRSRSRGHGDLKHLIQEIKESIAYEIRQEIVNELLAAVSPQRSPLPPRKPPV
ncbi:Sperm-specific antigen 2 [Triplophysa tibetana]|uniref:Sperm-specific antigen 2 n=1 Tax=Triplophysa tibetana TaxID=1572043 RepID=A0A5A9P2W8_9TELE|nr:Sperm-specific antigen 2 [Triplophysa tibetana]